MPNSNSFRRPWLFTNIEEPTPNMVWVAEYMNQHNLTLEVALEHMAKKMRDFLAATRDTVRLIEGSNADLLAEFNTFVENYKYMKDFYSPIPKVKMFKGDDENDG